MTHEEAVKDKFKREADKILTGFKPAYKKGMPYTLNLNKHEERKKELENAIRGIDAPDIDEDTKDEIVKWAKSEYDKYISRALKK